MSTPPSSPSLSTLLARESIVAALRLITELLVAWLS